MFLQGNRKPSHSWGSIRHELRNEIIMGESDTPRLKPIIDIKQLKIGPLAAHVPISFPDFAASSLVITGVAIRLILLAQGWPYTNIDEGTIGEMAMNIAYRGNHPVFFYGQGYMGALQAYLGAALFHLFGVSLFTLRLGLVFLFLLFLVSMYLLTRLLYTKNVALFTVSLLDLGAYSSFYRETQAIGGYPETLLFGATALLLASWLALTSRSRGQARAPGLQRRRLLAYCGWGLTVGLGLWSDVLVLPCVMMSGLLLVLFCWRDIRTLAPLCLLLCLVIGALPLILYNLHASPGHDTLTAVRLVYSERRHIPLLQFLPKSTEGAFLISLPTATNYTPVCDVSAALFSGGSGSGPVQCVLTQGAWSLAVIALWISAVISAIKTAWTVWFPTLREAQPVKQRQDSIRSCAHLAILFTVALSFVLFATSYSAIYEPDLNARYLICLLIGTPALISPLWNTASTIKGTQRKAATLLAAFKRVALLFIAGAFLSGTVATFVSLPVVQAENQQQYDLVHNLLRIGAKHIYSDIWNCDRIIFLSHEQIACSVLTQQLQPQLARDPINDVIVHSDPLASFVFPISSVQAKVCAQHFAHRNRSYQRFVLDGYVVYQPTG